MLPKALRKLGRGPCAHSSLPSFLRCAVEQAALDHPILEKLMSCLGLRTVVNPPRFCAIVGVLTVLQRGD